MERPFHSYSYWVVVAHTGSDYVRWREEIPTSEKNQTPNAQRAGSTSSDESRKTFSKLSSKLIELAKWWERILGANRPKG
jgi:hypothetical protein